MKKSVFVSALFFLLLAFGACASPKFDGSRTGNESQLIMDYAVLNMTDSQVLKLEEGDIVDFAVDSLSGEVDIRLEKEGEEPVYRGKNIPTSVFEVQIEESGSYTLSITGRNAKGSVSVVKR